MKHFLMFLSGLFFFSTLLLAQDSLLAPTDRLHTLPFKPGEKLTFKIRYGFIRAGTAEMMVLGEQEYNGREALHIQTTAKSVPAFSWIYKVRDVVDIFVNPQTLLPYHFQKKLREGNYKADLFVDYNFADSLGRGRFIRYNKDMSVKNEKKFNLPLKSAVYDVLTAFYFIRSRPLRVGHSFIVTAHEMQKVYNLEIKIYRKEIVDTEAGKFRCLLIEPLLKGEGIFKRKGRLKIWLTDDAYKIPVQMTSKVVVGHITTELIKMEGVPQVIPARLD